MFDVDIQEGTPTLKLPFNVTGREKQMFSISQHFVLPILIN